MSNGIKDAIGKLSSEKTVLGIDLTDEYTQISYGTLSGDVQTYSLSDTDERLSIPSILAKKAGENIWFAGEEAIEQVSLGEAVAVDKILAGAVSGSVREIDGMEYDPVELLALFLKKCLSKLSTVSPLERVVSVTITVDDTKASTIETLTEAISIIRIKQEQVFFLSHAEAGYHFILHQKQELQASDVLVCDLRADGLHTMLYSKNYRTTPVVVLVDEKHYSNFKPEFFEEDEIQKKKNKDAEFLTICRTILEGRRTSAVYLLGDGFSGEWFPDTLKYLCVGRRIFLGSNLFSKGACLGAVEKNSSVKAEKGYVFLGPERLKANLGMNIVREGQDAYMALLDAGKNWFDSGRECDLILEDSGPIEIIVTPLNGKNVRKIPIELKGFPKRPAKASRIHLEIRMASETKAEIKITDLGFGELYASSGLEWKSEFTL